MANIYPFHGYRYNTDKVEDLNRVITQPYDKIDKDDQEYYYQLSPYNIVRIILGKENNTEKDRYQKAAAYFNEWEDKDILLQDQEPGFYIYLQEYEVAGAKKTRKGFIGLGQLEAGDGVKAHENTMEGPKADRLKLMRATEANFGHIFMLYSDSAHKITGIIDRVTDEHPPQAQVKDKDENLHKLWKLEDKELITTIQQEMQGKNLYIADGHHRYQTALNFRDECYKKGWTSNGPEGFDNRLMTFVNMDDPGLTILATHRLLYGLKNFNPDKLLKKAEHDFEVNRYDKKELMYKKLEDDQGQRHTYGFGVKGKESYWTLTFDRESVEIDGNHSRAWQSLDVAILHKVILEGYLGIDEKALAEKRNLDYIRYKEEALNRLDNQDYQAAFILNPTRAEEVRAVADKGEKMPQKSTDFYPKLLTGLVFNKLLIDKN